MESLFIYLHILNMWIILLCMHTSTQILNMWIHYKSICVVVILVHVHCGGFPELWFSYAQIFETRHRITLPHGNRLTTFYKSITQAKSLRKFRQMKEMFAVLLHYTQQNICSCLGCEFSAKMTYFISVHSKVNCRKIHKYHRV